MTVTNTAIPVVSGTPRQGLALQTDNGSWTFDQDYLTYLYEWLRCDSGGSGCVAIPGANGTSYVLTAADVGSTIRSRVTATEHVSGSVLEAFPGQAVSVINGATIGQTVLLRGGIHSGFTLPKSVTGGVITVTCESGTYVRGLTTGGHSGYVFDGFDSRLPPEFVNYNIAAFYISGQSDNITIKNSYLEGGYLCLKVYCASPGFSTNLTLQDSELVGPGGDLIHVDGANGIVIDHNYLHDPVAGGAEHKDGLQIQRGNNWHFTRNIVKWDTIAVINDGPNQGVFVGQEPSPAKVTNGYIINNLFHHWHGGFPINVDASDGPTYVVNNTCADGASQDCIVVNDGNGPVQNVYIWNNIAGAVFNGTSPGAILRCDSNWWTDTSAGNTLGTNVVGTGSNPGWVDHVAYELTGGSPCRSAGGTFTNTPTVDLDGNARPGTPGIGCRI